MLYHTVDSRWFCGRLYSTEDSGCFSVRLYRTVGLGGPV